MTRTVHTCGKLYLAGEYAVLTAGQPALLAPIPIGMTATIDWAEAFALRSDLFDYGVDLTPDSNYALIQETIALFEAYLGQPLHPFALTITSQMARDGRKLGIGSSGAVVLLALRAMAELYALDLSADQLFRLAAAVLLKRGDNGSLGDLACIAYGDWVYYQSFDRQQVADWLTHQPLAEVLSADWGYVIKPMNLALTVDFLVGWTGQPAISSDLVNQVKSAITPDFLAASRSTVDGLYQALTAGDKIGVMTLLAQAGQLLSALHPAIVTPALERLCQATTGLSAVAKSSGAGGGDCGIALVFDETDSQTLIDRWEEQGIQLIYKERFDE
ncbi:phosphomevalonate kinase [Streptococcus entericus]|uniref:phosphomevalonate kinase n=1 Tax=Streptococcus entericus TaxID=155680 RepID=UPI0003812876|nr:phosphomevalonate kinase [Streptococcus entericus]